MERVTLKKIAKTLGVSIGTVDRAIHNRPDINPKTRERILEALKQYGYKTDKIARSLSLKPHRKRIGVISRETPEFFWDAVYAGIRTAQEELVDYGLEIIYRTCNQNNSIKVLIGIIDELVNEKVDAIAIVPDNRKQIKRKLDDVIDSGVSVVTFNDDLEESKRLFYVGPQAKQGGRVAGQLMGMFLKNKGNIITLNIDINSWEYQKRLEGFKEILIKDFPGIKIVDNILLKYTHQGKLDENHMKSVLENLVNIDGIYNVDGATLYNLAKTKSNIDKLNNCVIIGHEVSKDVRALIFDGSITACISQDSFSQGYYVIKMLFEYLDEGKLPQHEKMFTRLDVILRENLADNNNIINPLYI